jgi:hypothetical protein
VSQPAKKPPQAPRAGSYDVRFAGAEFAELIRHDVEIEPGKTTDLGTITDAAVPGVNYILAPRCLAGIAT